MSRLTLELEVDLPLIDEEAEELELALKTNDRAAEDLAQKLLGHTGAVVQFAQVCAV